MELMHTTQHQNVLSILKRGIIIPSSKSFKGKQNFEDFSYPDYIFLSAIENKTKAIEYLGSHWGDYYFFLNLDWVKSNANQFRNKGYSNGTEFLSFVNKYNIIEDRSISTGDYAHHQIISLKNIPVEALEGLLLSSNTGFLDINGIDSSLIKECKIIKEGYDKFIDLRELMPKNMGLYLTNKKIINRVN